jgi:hypothetical protein
MKLEISQQFPKKYQNINFHKSLSCWSRVAPCGRIEGIDGRTGMSKLMVAFHNLANASPNDDLVCWVINVLMPLSYIKSNIRLSAVL